MRFCFHDSYPGLVFIYAIIRRATGLILAKLLHACDLVENSILYIYVQLLKTFNQL